MKRTLLVVVLVSAIFVAGCGGVWVNSEYRELLDKTTEWSAVAAKRGEVGDLSLEDAVKLLGQNATLWRDFQNASLGLVEGD